VRESDKFAVRTSVVVPAFNEARRLPQSLPILMDAVRHLAGRTEIVLVDDGSTDGTSAVATEILAGFPDVTFVRLPWNCGKGAAVRRGVSAARGEVIAFLDADLSSDIDDLSALLALLDHADIALGSRSVAGAIVQGRTTARQVGSNAYRRLARAMTSGTIADTQCGFKAFRAPVAKLLFSMTSATGFGFDVEILTLATALGFTIAECPIHWTAMEGGHVVLRRHGLGMLTDLQRARRHRQRAKAAGWSMATHPNPWSPQAVSRPHVHPPLVDPLGVYLSGSFD
jgi:glycosyltransferase involved in cell wall biosynthesis